MIYLLYVDILFNLKICLVIDRLSSDSRDRIVVSTSRCGRDNPGSNPGHGKCCDRRCPGTAELFFFFFFLTLFSISHLYFLFLNCRETLSVPVMILNFRTARYGQAVDPDQTVKEQAVWSGCA